MPSKKTFPVRVTHLRQGVLMRLADARLVECRVAGGQVGVLPGHVPWMSALEPGILRVHTHRRVHELVVSGGLVRVTPEGRVACLVRDVFDADHADVGELRRQVDELEALRPDREGVDASWERDLCWQRLCLEAVERHLTSFTGVDHEEEEE